MMGLLGNMIIDGVMREDGENTWCSGIRMVWCMPLATKQRDENIQHLGYQILHQRHCTWTILNHTLADLPLLGGQIEPQMSAKCCNNMLWTAWCIISSFSYVYKLFIIAIIYTRDDLSSNGHLLYFKMTQWKWICCVHHQKRLPFLDFGESQSWHVTS